MNRIHLAKLLLGFVLQDGKALLLIWKDYDQTRWSLQWSHVIPRLGELLVSDRPHKEGHPRRAGDVLSSAGNSWVTAGLDPLRVPRPAIPLGLFFFPASQPLECLPPPSHMHLGQCCVTPSPFLSKHLEHRQLLHIYSLFIHLKIALWSQ